ncbi:MAG TPA: aldo/keto reductase [Propionibacteriaceae bacterium]
MHYRTLGNSGAVVSTFALGTMTFGAEADEATSHAILGDYLAAGGNLIDTADVYSKGASEEIIGRWLAAHPTDSEQVVIATKGRFGWLREGVSDGSDPQPVRRDGCVEEGRQGLCPGRRSRAAEDGGDGPDLGGDDEPSAGPS